MGFLSSILKLLVVGAIVFAAYVAVYSHINKAENITLTFADGSIATVNIPQGWEKPSGSFVANFIAIKSYLFNCVFGDYCGSKPFSNEYSKRLASRTGAKSPEEYVSFTVEAVDEPITRCDHKIRFADGGVYNCQWDRNTKLITFVPDAADVFARRKVRVRIRVSNDKMIVFNSSFRSPPVDHEDIIKTIAAAAGSITYSRATK